MNLNFAGHDLILHPSGVVLWEKNHMAIVSDLHLEKGSHFAKRGFFLPPYDSQETLTRLLKVLDENNVRNLIILGDSFHDSFGYGRLSTHAQLLFKQLHQFHPVWIKGNHDADFVPPGFLHYDSFELEQIVFRHQAVPDTAHEISGHFHPKVFLKNARLQRDCFIADDKKLILPAFGSYTGGLSVENSEIRSLFNANCTVYPLGENRVYRVPI